LQTNLDSSVGTQLATSLRNRKAMAARLFPRYVLTV